MEYLRWSAELMLLLQLSQKQLIWPILDLVKETSISLCQLQRYLRVLEQWLPDMTISSDCVIFPRCFYLVDQEVIAHDFLFDDADMASFLCLDSTQAYCLRQAHNERLQFCLSEYQTHGVGRRANRWHAPFAGGVLFSYKTSLGSHEQASLFAVYLSLIVVEAMKKRFSPLPLEIKWPNDLYLSGKKLVGILVDVVVIRNLPTVIVGVGCNYQSLGADHDYHKSFVLDSLRSLDKTSLTLLLMRCCLEVKRVLDSGGMHDFPERYNWHHALHHRRIVYDYEGTRCMGVVEGVNKLGALGIRANQKIAYLYASDAVSAVRMIKDD